MATEGKVVSQMLFGGILLGLSVLLIIPSSIGIAEYRDRAIPLVATQKNKAAENKLKAYEAVQITILVIALIAFLIAIYIMATSRTGKQYITATKRIFASKQLPPTYNSGAKPATVSLGGRQRQLSEFRLH